jgi:hypothetical protein
MTLLAEALHRDAAGPLEAYRARTWTPTPEERQFAEDLARSQWNAPFWRAALRHVPPAVRSGRLIDVLAPAADVLDQTVVAEDIVLQLRILIDALCDPP